METFYAKFMDGTFIHPYCWSNSQGAVLYFEGNRDPSFELLGCGLGILVVQILTGE